MMDRRTLLVGSAAWGLASAAAAAAGPEPAMVFGPEAQFSFDTLADKARALSQSPYRKPVIPDYDLLERLDFDAYQQIKFRSGLAIWLHGGGPYPVELFHLGRFFKEPARIFVVSPEGVAREVLYSPDLFSYGKSEFAKTLPPDAGFAGFRVLAAPGQPDWLAFLGASYFRSPAETGQYGLSARGLAIDTGLSTPEEFPRFISFWLQPMAGNRGISIYALLDSPRMAGAFRMDTVHEGGTFMDVEARLFPRADLTRVGIAPLTSMFWYSKHNRKIAADWRPEIHDSDGLSLWTGSGERIWRPLNDPTGVQTSTFFDNNPKGFGLLQRERRFSCYEDDGAFYDRRPSVWVEPVGDWGEGAVQLVEIPTADEIHDNIVAYWLPKEPFRAGVSRHMRYKLYWQLAEPHPPALAQAVATRLGEGGIPGQPRPKNTTKYVVDFEGGKLPQFSQRGDIALSVSASSGTIEAPAIYPVVGTHAWRAMFDFKADSESPADIRLHLRKGNEVLSETWVFQHLPSLSLY
jgi:periplasmic glucans biosynthesis protein